MYMDLEDFHWSWNEARREAASNVNLDVWAILSDDEGATWHGRQRVFEGYCGALINMIETTSGELVVPIQRLVRDPCRHAICVYVSSDGGQTWDASNIIDLGGHGHHDGAMEPTIVQLEDGRLRMLVRTNFDQFWNAFSEDAGRSWRVLHPSGIDASSAPGAVIRLASERLVLVWNRLCAVGQEAPPRRGGDGQLCLPMPSWHREELSIAFSEDDGTTWSEPEVILRLKDGGPSYPYIFEPEPGRLWVSTLFGYRAAMRLGEQDFVGRRGRPRPCAGSIEQTADGLIVRQMRHDDPATISDAFRAQGWNKPEERYERYYREQTEGTRTVLVAELDGGFVGYLTIVWESGYPPFRDGGIPEIVDFNVLAAHQRRGIGTILMDEAERTMSERSTVAGIGVGLTADYGAAQILYAKRGYVPDGRGLYYDGKQLGHGDETTVDDSLCLYFTKQVRA